jgi:hypothetical protein
MACLTSVLSAGALAENLDPKTDLEYAQVMMECYTENLPENERWEVLKVIYARGKVDKEGKKEVNISAKYSADNRSWKDAPSCHPLAPIVITESFLKSTGKFDDKFKSIELIVKWAGDFKVNIVQK